MECPYCIENVLYSLQDMALDPSNNLDPAEYARWKKQLLEKAQESERVREPQIQHPE